MLRSRATFAIAVGVFGLTLALHVREAQACGGLFCSTSAPVNQAAERIVFVENGDGTLTSVIEIQYEGPSEAFSWVLPVPGTPDVAVSSTTALDRLQALTNPRYILQTTFEDCSGGGGQGGSWARAGTGGGGGAAGGDPGVIVLAQGSVGPFDYEVIGLDPELPEPADAALAWLDAEGYDVTALAPEVLGPYLESGLNLLAFRLSKENDAGSIRPVVLTYESALPYIPIRPTAVAANDDMGIMVWVLSESRAVPENYKALELNEALIDWFNPGNTYDAVVSAAADEAGGQGFVTELAGSSDMLQDVVVNSFDRQMWGIVSGDEFGSAYDLVEQASAGFGSWDGFEGALRSALILPADVAFADFVACPLCYADNTAVTLDQGTFLLRLYEDVYRPMLQTQTLLLSRPYVTRLYTTMSADEMTMDPVFDFNPDLPDFSNVHTASQELACNTPGFRVTMEDGTTVYGETSGVWPLALGDLPANRKVLQLSTSGQGLVVMDNSEMILERLEALRPPTVGGGAGIGGSGRMGSRPDRGGMSGGAGMSGDGDDRSDEGGNVMAGADEDDDDGCAAVGPLGTRTRTTDVALVLLALGWIARRRRLPLGA